jgi:hypothetical protein
VRRKARQIILLADAASKMEAWTRPPPGLKLTPTSK